MAVLTVTLAVSRIRQDDSTPHGIPAVLLASFVPSRLKHAFRLSQGDTTMAQRQRTSQLLLSATWLAILTLIISSFGTSAHATVAASTSNQVLILNSTVTGGVNSIEAQAAIANGLEPVVVDEAVWSSLTTAQFASYRALILGDATCSENIPTAAVTNAATWGQAVTGNVIINGTDPVFHASQGGALVTRRLIDFVVSNTDKTGAYISLSCYYHETAPQTPVSLLDALRPGGFTVSGVGCYNDAHIVATHPALTGLSDATLSNWSCSVHEAFDTYPPDYTVLAIARNIGSTYTASDGSIGTPYILASGAGLRSFPLSLSPVNGSGSVGSSHIVTAQLLDSTNSAPVTGATISFTVTSGPSTGASGICSPSTACITGSDGTVSWSYSNNGQQGVDTIKAFLDLNGNRVADSGEPQTTAGMTWTQAQGEQFVYVALGDSFQSGEGVGNSLLNTNDFLNLAYENGSNYPQTVGSQTNTYSNFGLGGNDCHRALANYAKLNRNRLQPGAEIVLIDVTCSGARIVPEPRPAIVGSPSAGTFDPASQVQQALNQLRSKNLTAADVDLVTVGMGGNDAKFVDIITACLAPSLLRRVVQQYPNTPGEASVIVNNFVNCEFIDNSFIHSSDAIQQLTTTERWAQGQLLQVFTRARVMQLNYPVFLPKRAQGIAEWCGGIRKSDLDYARQRAMLLNASIASAFQSTADSRLQLVNMADAFGSNPLCSHDANGALINGISQENFDAEVDRLLNLNGTGDAESRRLLDQIVSQYNALKQCGFDHYNPFGRDCDVAARRAELDTTITQLLTYLFQQLDTTILPNLAAPPSSGESPAVRLNRGKGLLHPNANGHIVIACNVRAVFNAGDTRSCQPDTRSITDIANANPIGNAPIRGGRGVQVRVQIGGFGFGVSVRILLHSTPIELGTVVSNSAGVIDTTITLPSATAGVHTLQFQGNTPNGAQVIKQVRVNYPERPSGKGEYGVYLSGFTPTVEGVQPEQIDIFYLGDLFGTLTPDEEGGVFFEVPLFDLLNYADPISIMARSRATGRTVQTTIDPIPTTVGLWATSTQKGALSITGARTTVSGRVHSNADIIIGGSRSSLTSGIEYATTLAVSGSGHTLPSTRKVASGGLPTTWDIAAYRPGGSYAISAGSAYRSIPQSACVRGVWSVTAAAVPSGVVYVPCAVAISGSNRLINAMIVAESAISISGSAITINSGLMNQPALLSAAGSNAISISGARMRIQGLIQALNGDIAISGADGYYEGGVIAKRIMLSGAGNTISVGERP
jgi:hypothetical protein